MVNVKDGVKTVRLLWLEREVINNIISEANEKYPLETGGLLAGYYSDKSNEIVVQMVTYPGTDAIHGKYTYKPDYPFDEKRVGDIYDHSNGEITYLGDWHAHPNSAPGLSRRDRRVLRNIAKFPENYIDAPVMLIFGQTFFRYLAL